jgi:hypothetical protein
VLGLLAARLPADSVLRSLLPDLFVLVHVLPKARPDAQLNGVARTLLAEGLYAFDKDGRADIAREVRIRLAELVADAQIQIRSVLTSCNWYVPDMYAAHKICSRRS